MPIKTTTTTPPMMLPAMIVILTILSIPLVSLAVSFPCIVVFVSGSVSGISDVPITSVVDFSNS